MEKWDDVVCLFAADSLETLYDIYICFVNILSEVVKGATPQSGVELRVEPKTIEKLKMFFYSGFNSTL